MKKILDMCCGSRMFWFDKSNKDSVFLDKRNESHTLNDRTKKSGKRILVIRPDIIADFTRLPFPSNFFKVVVFDPPHFESNGANSWLNLKYGTLKGDWESMLAGGFSEGIRVLIPFGVLIFKWSSVEIPLSKILKLSDIKPMFGHKSGKQSATHWVSFMKDSC